MPIHEAVIAAGEKESGITIHYINNQYDKGDPIFQAEDGIRDAREWLEFRRVLFRSVIEVDSAGTYGGHAGELPDARMRRAAVKRG